MSGGDFSELTEVRSPQWLPDGWADVAGELLAVGNRQFAEEAGRLFSLQYPRAKKFWKSVDNAWEKRGIARMPLSLNYTRRQILATLWFRGGKLPSQSVAAIKADRLRIADAIKRLRSALKEQPQVANVKILDLIRYATDVSAQHEHPDSLGDLSGTLQQLGAGLGVVSMLSPTLTEILEGLENRLRKQRHISAMDPLVSRNVFAPQSGRKNAQAMMLERALRVRLLTCTGKPHDELVAAGVEMAMGLPPHTIASSDVRNRARAAT